MAQPAESDPTLLAAHAAIYHALSLASPKWFESRPAQPAGIHEPMPMAAAIRALQQAPSGPCFRISAAMLAFAAWGKQLPGTHPVQAGLRALLDTPINDNRVPSDYPEQLQVLQSAQQALGFVENAVHVAQGGGACVKQNHVVRFAYDTRFSIASAEASVEVNRPMRDFIDRGNPRDWSTTAPELFLRSAAIPNPPPNPGRYPLQEVARAALNGDRISEYSNVLNITYQGSPSVELQYDLSCSESCDVAVYRGPGGLSVDSGGAFIRGLTPQSTVLQASKSLRHTFPNGDPSAEFMNWLSVPALVFLMSWFIFDGACA